jgi:hypothetical protein
MRKIALVHLLVVPYSGYWAEEIIEQQRRERAAYTLPAV